MTQMSLLPQRRFRAWVLLLLLLLTLALLSVARAAFMVAAARYQTLTIILVLGSR